MEREKLSKKTQSTEGVTAEPVDEDKHIERYIILSDQQLVTMSQDGDRGAFEQLIKRYNDSVYQLFMQRTGSRDEAQDLYQETFIKVFLNLAKYNPNYTFGQWVYAVARNTFVDYLRKRQDNVLSIDAVPHGSTVMSPSALQTPEEVMISSQRRAQLEEYMQSMTPQYRKLIELRFFKDYSYEEIAQELALPLGTVKTQIHRARTQLCRLILDDPDILY